MEVILVKPSGMWLSGFFLRSGLNVSIACDFFLFLNTWRVLQVNVIYLFNFLAAVL